MKVLYVIEENVFQAAIGAAIEFGRAKSRPGGATDQELSEYQEKRRACLDHMVPDWATHFVDWNSFKEWQSDNRMKEIPK